MDDGLIDDAVVNAELHAEADRMAAEGELRSLLEELGLGPLTFDPAGIESAARFINWVRDNFAAEDRDRWVYPLGAFVGAAVIRTLGGQWAERDGTWGVQVGGRIWSNPFRKVEKQLMEGPEESVAGLFRAIAQKACELGPGELAEPGAAPDPAI